MGLKVVYHKRSRRRPAVGSLKMFSKVWAGCRKPAGPSAAHGQVRWADRVRGTGFLGGSPGRRQLGGSALTPARLCGLDPARSHREGRHW